MSPFLFTTVASAIILSVTTALRAADAPFTAADTSAFSTDLYAKISPTKGNLFFSPTSIQTALAMTYVGARGTTANQMAQALSYKLSADKLTPAFATLLTTLNHAPEIQGFDPHSDKETKSPAYQLVIANALWGQQGFPFKTDFTTLLQKSYAADLHPVDFAHAPDQARTTINDWVATQTKDKIKDLIAKGVLTPQTRLVLTNAIYFKSNWEHKFQKSSTSPAPFHLTPDQSASVPMMHQTHDFAYLQTDDLQLLELPYTQNALSMFILLPKKRDGLAALEKSLTPANLATWLKDKSPQLVQVTLPKFTFSADLALADTLKSLGMTDAFNPDKADFSGISAAEKIWISAVIHKAFVAVDEEGTEAAAATAIAMAALAMRAPQEPQIFTADHPFIFLIRHNPTNQILFLGRLANPQPK